MIIKKKDEYINRTNNSINSNIINKILNLFKKNNNNNFLQNISSVRLDHIYSKFILNNSYRENKENKLLDFNFINLQELIIFNSISNYKYKNILDLIFIYNNFIIFLKNIFLNKRSIDISTNNDILKELSIYEDETTLENEDTDSETSKNSSINEDYDLNSETSKNSSINEDYDLNSETSKDSSINEDYDLGNDSSTYVNRDKIDIINNTLNNLIQNKSKSTEESSLILNSNIINEINDINLSNIGKFELIERSIMSLISDGDITTISEI